MTFYSGTILITILLMVAMLIHVLKYSGFNKNQKIYYSLTFSSIIICALAEFAVHCGYYDPKFDIALTMLTVLQFSIAPLLGVLFTAALGVEQQKKVLIIYFIFNLIIESILAPFGLIFNFDLNGYSRGKYFFIYGIFYFISLIYLLFCMIFVGKKFKHRDLGTIIMAIVVIVAGIIPMTAFKINITYLAIAIAACLFYIFYNDLVQEDIQDALILNQNKITDMQSQMISGLANIIENRDLETGEHITRTSSYVKKIALLCKKEDVYTDELTDEYIHLIYTLAPMHDIGKIMVSDAILRKPGKLTKEEFEEMKKHSEVGGNIVKEVLNGVTDENHIKVGYNIAKYHHERWDGKGYPEGLCGEAIPLSARIMAVADVFDALISKRCYKEAMPYEEAFKIIEEESGTHFDPNLVKVFLKYKEEFISK